MLARAKNLAAEWWLRILVLLLLLSPYLLWVLAPTRPVQLLAVDKTVPVSGYREHQGLFWLLNHGKYVKPDGSAYRLESDYYGYHPDRGEGDMALTVPPDLDLIYVADTYGVFEADLGENPRGVRSRLLYGGLKTEEWNQLWNAKGAGTTLVIEYNAIASPTDARARLQVENDLGIAWTGWVGRHFAALESPEVPVWLVENWERHTGQRWEFTGPGLAFVDEQDQVVVLDSEEAGGAVRFVPTDAGRSHYPGLGTAPYPYWFDVILPSQAVTVEANYQLAVSAAGQARLQAAGIPLTFPAVVRHPVERAYYFAGDYADRKGSAPVRMVGSPRVMSWLAAGPEELFYWRVYVPMMQRLLAEAAQ